MRLPDEGSGMKRDSEVLLMRRERAKGRTQEQAAARAGMSVRTLRRYERRGKLPSQFQEPRTYRTRPSPFAEDWPWIASQLERDPALEPGALNVSIADVASGQSDLASKQTIDHDEVHGGKEHADHPPDQPDHQAVGWRGRVGYRQCVRRIHRR